MRENELVKGAHGTPPIQGLYPQPIPVHDAEVHYSDLVAMVAETNRSGPVSAVIIVN